MGFNECVMAKRKMTTIRLKPEIKAAAEKAAKASNRSLSGLVEFLLIEVLKREGYLNE